MYTNGEKETEKLQAIHASQQQTRIAKPREGWGIALRQPLLVPEG